MLGIVSRRDDLTDAQHFDENHTNDRIFYPSDVLEPAGLVEGTILDAATTLPVSDGWVDAFDGSGGDPGAQSGGAQVCPDGTYRMKLPEGEHYIWAGDSSHLRGWYSPSDPADYCALDAESVFVEQGETASGVDVRLDLPSSISGSVRLYAPIV